MSAKDSNFPKKTLYASHNYAAACRMPASCLGINMKPNQNLFTVRVKRYLRASQAKTQVHDL